MGEIVLRRRKTEGVERTGRVLTQVFADRFLLVIVANLGSYVLDFGNTRKASSNPTIAPNLLV